MALGKETLFCKRPRTWVESWVLGVAVDDHPNDFKMGASYDMERQAPLWSVERVERIERLAKTSECLVSIVLWPARARQGESQEAQTI